MVEDREPIVSVETFAAGLNAKQLACRELGHRWAPLTVSWDAGARAYDRQLRCSNCRTIRKQVLDSSGHVLRNGYDYAAGYLASNVEKGQLSRDVFRLEALTRFLSTEGKQ
jgi:hypothetical protein